MTIPRIPSLLILLMLGQDALALQMGQITGASVRGQPLLARVSLYGVPAHEAGDTVVELLPAFGKGAETLSQFGLQARLSHDEPDGQAIIVTSTQPIDAATLALRVRLREGRHALVRHYELTLPAAATAPLARSPRTRPVRRALRPSAEAVAVAVTLDGGAVSDYGPVRAGQSLWGILQETGLTRGDSRKLMQHIVATNPAAFVAGDARRLRVGVMLRLPKGASAARVTPAPAVASTPRKDAQALDAETAARMARLAQKFKEIRARYDAQQAQAAATSALHAPTTATARTALPALETDTKAAPTPSMLVNTVPERALAETKAAPQRVALAAVKPHAKPIAVPEPVSDNTVLDVVARYVDGRILVGVGTLLLLFALTLGAIRFARRLRGRIADAGVRSADRDMVAEIARKTEKRVQLEDEVKRMIAGRIDDNEKTAKGGLRPSDLLVGARATLEEIETRIAHGQYNEAEAMLEQTIVDAPNNFRAKLRLAEIYYLNERHEEFVDLAEEIYRQHRSDIGDENWARLMRMGKVIAPDRPPFSGPVAVEGGRRAL